MMNARSKIREMPIDQLWDDDGFFGTKLRDLTLEEVDLIVKTEPVRCVEASLGSPLNWISNEDFKAFWRFARPNIAKEDRIFLDEYSGGFAYGASEWLGRSGESIVLLEKFH
jgi:hypothetical protein